MATVVAAPTSDRRHADGRWAMLARQADYWFTLGRRTWRGNVVTGFLTPLLYVAAMGLVLGRFIDEANAGVGGAPSYLHFIAPGLLAGQAMLLAVGDSTWPVYGRMVWDKTYLAMIATPLRVSDVVAAHLLAIVARVTLSCAVFMLALSLFGLFAGWAGALAALLVQLLIAFAFAGAVFAFTVGLRSDSAFAFLHRVVQVPMYLFSGVFFPLDNLAEPWQWVAKALPLWHGVELTRMSMLQQPDIWAALVHVAYLLIFGGVGAWLAARRLQRRLIV